MAEDSIFRRMVRQARQAVDFYEDKVRPELLTQLRPDALRLRGAPKPLPQGPDEDGNVSVRWDVAEAQIKFEAEFAAFVLMWWGAEPPKDPRDAKRKAMAATLVYHGHDPEAAPTKGIFDILHKEDIDE